MSEPISPEKANVKIDQDAEKRKLDYKAAYDNYMRLQNEKCYCDRASCIRCLDMMELKRVMDGRLYPRNW